MLTSVSFGVFTDYTERGGNGMASERSYKNQNSTELWATCKFQWIYDQGKLNLVGVSGEVKLSEFELTMWKWLKCVVIGISLR